MHQVRNVWQCTLPIHLSPGAFIANIDCLHCQYISRHVHLLQIRSVYFAKTFLGWCLLCKLGCPLISFRPPRKQRELLTDIAKSSDDDGDDGDGAGLSENLEKWPSVGQKTLNKREFV